MLSLIACLLPIAPEWTTHYTVTFSAAEPAAQRAEIEGHVEWEGGRGRAPEDIVLEMADEHANFVEGFATRNEDGEFTESAFLVEVLDDGRGEFRYSVPLAAYDPAAWQGWDETPHAVAEAVLWTGRALFATVGEGSAEVVFEVPDDGHVSTSLAVGKDGAFLAPDERTLRETYFLVGEHHENLLEIGGSEVVLALDGDVAVRAERVEELVIGFLNSATEAMGGPPPQRCMVLLTRAEGEGGGAQRGRDAHVLVSGAEIEGRGDVWVRTLCHEMFHHWNPHLVGFDSREMWFSEGFTDYYTHLLLARIGELDSAAFLGHVRGWAESYLAQDRIGLREAGVLGAKNNAVIYQGGALAALCLDLRIREETRGKRSLEDVMQTLYELNARNGGPVSIDELRRLLKKHAPRSAGDFLERHVAGDEPLPLEEALALAGLQLEGRTVQVPGREDAIVHLFQCSGMTVVGDGIEVNRCEGGRLKPGDLVQEIAGRRVRDFGDLQRALADREPGDKVEVIVQRKGKREEVEVRLGGHGRELESSPAYEVVLEPLGKASRRARGLREAIFGKD